MSIQRINPSTRWSDATIFNGIAHFVEVPEQTDPDISKQTQQVFAQAERTLASFGSDKSQLLSATIYLTDFTNLSTFNALWDAWLPKGCAPSRACVKVALVDPDYLVEIAFVAAKA